MTPHESPHEQITKRESPGRRLAYFESFKDAARSNPGLIKTVLELHGRLEVNLDEMGAEKGVIRITRLNKDKKFVEETTRKFNLPRAYMLEIGDEKFFLKIEHSTSHGIRLEGQAHGGYDEIKGAQSVRELIKKFPWVEIVDYKLGYTDKAGNKYLVSSWRNLHRASDYLPSNSYPTKLPRELPDEKLQDLENKVIALQGFLGKTYYDVNSFNMFYDPETKKIILFDLVEREK